MYLEVNKSCGGGVGEVQVLKSVSASIKKGEMCVILGPSWSGKAIFLNAIGGLDEVDSGSIKVDGREIANVGIGMDFTPKWYFYPIIYAENILCYLLISVLLTKKLNKVVVSDVLKNRE